MTGSVGDWVTAGLMVIGSAFALLAALGVVRMPDLFTRMQAATKSSTLGVGCILLAVAVHFDELGVTTQALLTIAFLLLTAPIAAHMIARSAYIVGVPLWKGTVIDELREREPPQATGDAAEREAKAHLPAG
ncbi:MAG TPA: monovalent cation/H(+) antiporter subunit G [Planctomycetaceae bacterium]|nr:monovalent cation/H(+) antiporter subunit G [Planctomycetaceae bacterium]